MQSPVSSRFRAALITSLTITQWLLTPLTQAAPSGLSVKELSGNLSSELMQADVARVLTDNNESFKAKIAAINNAQKSLKLAYYIYSDDYSSSAFTQALLNAARRGVQVELLVDFLTNYKFADLFSMIEHQSNSKIKVYFYNVPNLNIQRFAEFVATDCSLQAKESVSDRIACSKEKMTYVNSAIAKGGSFFGKMFLAGLSAKSGMAVKVAVGIGGNLEAEKKHFAERPKATEEEKAKLRELLKLMFESKVKKDVTSMVQLAAAMTMYADDINPIYNLISGLVPLETDYPGFGQDVAHLSDFLHHKILLSDDKEIIVGGRNIEDSYHMTPEQRVKMGDSVLAKYTFQDTEFYAQIKQVGKSQGVREAYDRLIGFKEMVKPLPEVLKLIPIELVQNAQLAAMASYSPECVIVRANPAAFDACVAKNFAAASKVDLQTRIAKQLQTMTVRADQYRNTFANWSGPVDKIGINSDLITDPSMRFAFIENLPFALKGEKKRHYGVSNVDPTASGKNIHALIQKSLRQVCKDSRSLPTGQKIEVTFNQGYVLFSTDMIHTFGNMINRSEGFGECSKVQVDIITNSIETTDLNPINYFARHQLKALLDYAKQQKYAPRFRIFEMTKRVPLISLHSKVNILGNDIIIGSANMDVRSYYMDTNNGIFISSAPALVNTYNTYLNKMKTDNSLLVEITQYLQAITIPDLKQQDRDILIAMIQYFENKSNKPVEKRLTADTEKMELLHRVARWLLDETFQSVEKALQSTSRQTQIKNREFTRDRLERNKIKQIESEDAINKLLMVL